VTATDRRGGRVGSVVLKAPAKLTRRLRIVGRRPDGYHLLAAEMITVNLYDELRVSSGDGFEVSDEVEWLVPGAGVSGAGGASAAGAGARAPAVDAASSAGAGAGAAASVGAFAAGAGAGALASGGANLVELALQAVGRSARIQLIKRIPAGAGLGGGSADAAAVLRWAGKSDPEAAVRLGSDVPFCLVGGRALVSGVGEIVEPLPHKAADILLLVPRLHISTPAVYAAWDALGGPTGEGDNDLEPAALALEPRLAWWRDLVAEVSGQRPCLAGSGGTWWIEGDGALVEVEQAVSSAVIAERESAVVKLVKTIPASTVA
jgi:4-diphosphocytidyl-2-C-methyl-D-erythritol kinase